MSAQDRRLVWLFGGLALAQLVVIGVNVAGAPDSFRLSHDGNVPAALNSIILFAIAGASGGMFLLAGRWRHRATRPVLLARWWRWIAVAFLYFGVDEAVMIHERVAELVFRAAGVWDKMLSGDVTFAAWEALFAPLFGGVALLALVLLLRHRHLSSAALWAGLAAIGVWGIALLMEFVGLTFLSRDQYGLRATSNVEETAEMLGSTLFLAAVALTLRGAAGWNRRPAASAAALSPVPSDAD